MSTRENVAPALWRPAESFVNHAHLTRYAKWLEERYGLKFTDYNALWQWSVDRPAAFWESVSRYFGVIHHTPYREVMSPDPMPGTRWFTGSTLNYAEHVFRRRTDERPAIVYRSERHALAEMNWDELAGQVAALRNYLRKAGVGRGDRVVAFLPNAPEATVSFLAACSLGAVWSSCSPDFGVNSVVDRFRQIAPRVLIAADGYSYNGKPYDKMATLRSLVDRLPTLEKVILVSFLKEEADHHSIPKAVSWQEAVADTAAPLEFDAVPFDHPIWVLYSSGTTGKPKAITHAHGGVLLEHLKYLAFHNDVHPGERFFWFSTTGWMMWNFVQASLLLGATIVLYDGSPAFPDLNAMWALAEKARISHFGTSAPFLVACMKEGLSPSRQFDLGSLRSVGSTGAPLPPEAFDWVYAQLKEDVWLCSMSGGTDVCTAFVGGCPWEPVYEGEIQCRALGCALYAYDDDGRPVTGRVGEMVITEAMPSMPVFFWGDEDRSR